ncbi:MAG TPA: helix-turn-helix transcriptional regulator [Bacteroidia bacterium]|nr:helix-turn-helix transcriptional regulator [Bacteroidia bacterium]
MKKQAKKRKSTKKTVAELEFLGKRIKQLRKEKGYTNQEIFAYDNDLNRAQYNKYERGGDIRFSSLVKLIKALDISVKEFFSEGFD